MSHNDSTRRGLLKGGLAAATGGLLLSPQAVNAQQAGQGAPAVITKKRFRGWVSVGRNSTLEEMTLLPVQGRQVLVRTEACNLCYSNVGAVLGARLPQAVGTGGPGGPGAPIAGGPGGAPPGAGRGGPGRGGVAAAGRGGPGGPGGAQPPAPGANPAAAAAKPPAGGGFGGGFQQRLNVQGHGGIGIVEAVGPEVRRVRVGDRVCVSGTPQCGNCYQCLRGRSDQCQFLFGGTFLPMAELADGRQVFQNSHIGGMAEYMATYEEWVVPIFTKSPAAEVAMVCSCVSVAGLGSTTSPANLVQPGMIVAVVGCGPLGLSAVQGARIAGAQRIIAIDPVKYRRDAALKVGATHVLDPNAENNLLQAVRNLTSWTGNNPWGGGRTNGLGPDFVIEGVGAESVVPKVERGPDPSGVDAIQNAYMMCAPGGDVVTTSLARGNISLSAGTFNIGGRTHHSGQAGGCSPMRDIPRFVAMLDSGRYDAKALATRVVPMAEALDAYEEVAYRTTITAIMTA